jgi:hypothetical protein
MPLGTQFVLHLGRFREEKGEIGRQKRRKERKSLILLGFLCFTWFSSFCCPLLIAL